MTRMTEKAWRSLQYHVDMSQEGSSVLDPLSLMSKLADEREHSEALEVSRMAISDAAAMDDMHNKKRIAELEKEIEGIYEDLAGEDI